MFRIQLIIITVITSCFFGLLYFQHFYYQMSRSLFFPKIFNQDQQGATSYVIVCLLIQTKAAANHIAGIKSNRPAVQ